MSFMHREIDQKLRKAQQYAKERKHQIFLQPYYPKQQKGDIHQKKDWKQKAYIGKYHSFFGRDAVGESSNYQRKKEKKARDEIGDLLDQMVELLGDDDGMSLLDVAEIILDTGLVPRFPTAILATGMMMCAMLALVCGAVLNTVTVGRREAKLLAYLSIPAPASSNR